MSRISFGIRGAQLPALVRGAVAIAWFGIQTYLAARVFSVLLIAVHRGFADRKRLDTALLGLDWLDIVDRATGPITWSEHPAATRNRQPAPHHRGSLDWFQCARDR